MEALGRLFNIIPTADNVTVNMKNCSAVTFICVGADTYTLSESKAGASTQALATIDHSYRNATGLGAAAWTKFDERTGSPLAQVSAIATTGTIVAVFSVEDTELSDGFTHLKVASAGAGLVYAITHDLTVQRDPRNLPAVAV